MATTPAPLLWDFWRKSAQTAVSTGGLIDYYDAKAQELLPPADDGGISSSDTVVENGHWSDAEWSEHAVIDAARYTLLDFDHPARGTWYGVADLPQDSGAGYDTDTFWLLRYEYEKRLDPITVSGSIVMQTDSPIQQLNMAIINTGRKTFLSDATLFSPGAKIETGLLCGNSSMYPMGIYYIDEIGYDVLSETVSISGRNTIGYILSTQTFDNRSSFTGSVSEVVRQILEYFGITGAAIEYTTYNVAVAFEPGTTGLAALQEIAEQMTRFDASELYALYHIGETPDGTIVCGYDDYFAGYLPNHIYQFPIEHEVFRYSVNRCADDVYTKVRMEGTDADGEPLDVEMRNVTYNHAWNLGEHRVYHGSASNVTQETLSQLAANNALLLSNPDGVTSVTMSIRPQLLIGDYAKIEFADGEVESAGIITSITHRFGKSGFFTDFTAAKSGRYWVTGDRIATRAISVNGSIRTQNITDYFMKKKG